MSDAPETDHLEDELGNAAKFSHPVLWRHARDFERDRDEAITRRMETIMQCELYEQERDEARKELSSIHRWIERNHADGFIDSLTYLQNLERVTDNWYDRIDAIEKDSKRFVRERDEARELLASEKITRDHIIKRGIDMQKERDEAREQRDRLANIAKQIVSILDITEESGNVRLFHPTNITSCRAGDLQKIGELVEALRRASTDRIIRNAEIAELEQLKEGAK